MLSYQQRAPLPSGFSQADDHNPARKIAILLLVIFVFLVVSRFTDSTPVLGQLHLPLAIAILMTVAGAVSGALSAIFKTREFKVFVLMTGWMILGLPFAVYRFGTFQIVAGEWLPRTVLVSLLAIGLTLTFKEAGYLMNALAVAALAAALIGLRSGAISSEGRLAIGGGSNIGNPNDIAFVVLIGVPFWLRFMLGGGVLRRCVGAVALLPIAACFVKTGSRGGMLEIAAMAAAAFCRASMPGKLKIAVAGLLAFAIGWAMTPSYLRERYFTLDDAGVGPQETAVVVAAGSASQRKETLIKSVKMAITHPLFGVGAGGFATAENLLAVAEGRSDGTWIGTHNTYTQLASECGIPVAILFVYLLGASIRSVAAARKRLANDSRPLAGQIRNAAMASEAVLWGTATFIAFAHRGYDLTLYLLIAVATIVARTAERELPPLPAPPRAFARPVNRWAVARVR